MKWLIGAVLVCFLLGMFGVWYGGASTDTETVFENAPLTLSAEPAVIASEPSFPPPPDITDSPNLPPFPVMPAPSVEEEEAPSLAPSQLILVDRPLRFGSRAPEAPRSIDTVVLHSSYNALGGDVYSVERTIEEYEQYGVGAHYLIDRAGTLYRLIDEARIAYHAGASKMTDGRKNVNDFSIGIELIGTEESGFTDKQYRALNVLLADIRTRHQIKFVVGHADIAPGRKTDPWKFDWKRLQ
jgi:hypothetical protein